MKDENYERLWNDPANWGGGFCGWYFCKEDPRLWVPKKIRSMGITLNLGHPRGGATLVAMFLLPSVMLAIGLIFVAVAAGACH